jgi:hypothetical protein
MYRGAKWLGIEPIKLQDGTVIQPQEIVTIMPEQEAKNRIGFEPVYHSEKKQSKKKEKDDE